ncbi:MAG: hypothetical protein GX621_13500 [Pirellulaceae bacterium]|nr:hypothetical protein [Pirellulaceae bacterium]
MAKTKTSSTKRTVASKDAKSKTTARKNAADTHAAKAHATKKAAEPSRKKPTTKKTARNEPGKDCPAGERLVTVDRRRTENDRRKKQEPVAVERRSLERRAKVSRRRQIDPTTCERDYSAEELEFMNALDAYKRTSGRMFPTCSEILEVVRGLGYQKASDEEQPGDDASVVPPSHAGANAKPNVLPVAALDTADSGAVVAATLAR